MASLLASPPPPLLAVFRCQPVAFSSLPPLSFQDSLGSLYVSTSPGIIRQGTVQPMCLPDALPPASVLDWQCKQRVCPRSPQIHTYNMCGCTVPCAYYSHCPARVVQVGLQVHPAAVRDGLTVYAVDSGSHPPPPQTHTSHGPCTQGRVKWAMAGRDQRRLETVREELAKINPDIRTVPILVADAHDAKAVRGVLDQTKVGSGSVGCAQRTGGGDVV